MRHFLVCFYSGAATRQAIARTACVLITRPLILPASEKAVQKNAELAGLCPWSAKFGQFHWLARLGHSHIGLIYSS
jgi:hypothetical protein